jgi:deoxyribonuclease V
MIACVDVHYLDRRATAACVLATAWPEDKPASESVVAIGDAEAYIPGQFFRRELPCLLAVLKEAGQRPYAVIIDGYVWMGDEGNPGLGAHLYEALGRQAVVIGVAKTKFLGANSARMVTRGRSLSPLYVTAAGMNLSAAADHIQEMHGAFRIPTLIKRADQLSRLALL